MSTVANPFGVSAPEPIRALCTMRGSAGLEGNIVFADFGNTDGFSGVSDGAAFGGELDATAQVILATNTHDEMGLWFGVLEAAVDDNATVMVTFRGVVRALGAAAVDVSGGVGNTSMTVVTASELGASVTNSNIIALALEDTINSALTWFVFDGINKYGYDGT